MPSSLISRNVTLSEGRTSLRLEAEFWSAIADICDHERLTLAEWIEAATAEGAGGRTSSVRVGVLRYFRRAAALTRSTLSGLSAT